NMDILQHEIVAASATHANHIPGILNTHARHIFMHQEITTLSSRQCRQTSSLCRLIFNTTTDDKIAQGIAASRKCPATSDATATIRLATGRRLRESSTTRTAGRRLTDSTIDHRTVLQDILADAA